MAKLGHLAGRHSCGGGRCSGSRRELRAAAVRVQLNLLRLEGGRRNRRQRRLGTARIVERVLLQEQLLLLTSGTSSVVVVVMMRPADRVRVVRVLLVW